MKTTIKRFLIILLVFVPVTLVIFSQLRGWEKRPHLDTDINRIEVFSGQFRLPDEKPNFVIDSHKNECLEIVKAINKSQPYPEPVKLGTRYSIDIIHSNSQVDSVEISSTLIAIHSTDRNEGGVYSTQIDISKIIDSAIKK